MVHRAQLLLLSVGATTASITAIGGSAARTYNTPVQYSIEVTPEFFDPVINALPGVADGTSNQVTVVMTGLTTTTFSRTSNMYSLLAGARSSTVSTSITDPIATGIPVGDYQVCCVVSYSSPYFFNPIASCTQLTVTRGPYE